MLHISNTDHGQEITFLPKTYSADSITIPRICVAPTLAGCLSAIKWIDIWSDDHKPIFIYQADTQELPTPCNEDVPDRSITNEHWYLSPTRFTLVHIIEPNSILHKRLVRAVIDSWAEMMDREPCSCAKSQTAEFALFTNIISSTNWGVDNVAGDNASKLFFDHIQIKAA